MNIKKSKAIVIILIFVFIFITLAYIFFKGNIWFISSLDGNNSNKNYTLITKDYHLLNSEKTICLNTDKGFKRISSKVDSLNFDDGKIVGYDKMGYFVIYVPFQTINYFQSRDSLLKEIKEFPANSLSKSSIPRFILLH